jgi:hypothetical protein
MLLPKIEKFLRTSGMAWTRFGRIVAHDPRLVSDMRNGRLPRPALAAKVERYIEGYAAAHAGGA